MEKIRIIISLFITLNTFAQSLNPNLSWVKKIGGAGTESTTSMDIDEQENVYFTGKFYNTVDFDPGVNYYPLTVYGQYNNIYIVKLDRQGNFVYAKQIKSDSPWNESGKITVDGIGNVYVSGWFSGIADFDPGVGTHYVSVASRTFFILKLNNNGDFCWVKTLGINNQSVEALNLDKSGHLYFSGSFENTVDFDPSSSQYNLTSNGASDIFILKMDTSGNFVWAKSYGGSSGGTYAEAGRAIAFDANDNPYIIGTFFNVVNFNGISLVNNSNQWNTFFLKLDVLGNFIFVKQIGNSNSIAYGSSLYSDSNNNVFIAGFFQGIVDFDLGVNTFTLQSSGSGSNSFLLKLNSNDQFTWAINTGGRNCNVFGVDLLDNVYTDIQNLSSSNPNQISKFNPNGGLVWNRNRGTAFTASSKVKLSNIYFSGEISTPYAYNFAPTGSYNLTSAGYTDVFVCKWNQCSQTTSTITVNSCGIYTSPAGNLYTTSGMYTDIINNHLGCDSIITINLTINTLPSLTLTTTNNILCVGQTASLHVTGANTYSWSTGVIANTLLVSPTVTTIYTVIGTSNNGCNSTSSITQNVSAIPSLSITNSTPLCSGSTITLTATGASTYSWNTLATTNTITDTPTSNVSYTVTGTDVAGCFAMAVKNLTINTLPLVTAASTSASICQGKSVVLSSSGANTYSWSTGSASSSTTIFPTTSAIYTVTGTDANGCKGLANVSVTVNSLPTLTVAGTNTLLCLGQSASLTVNGANTYSWSTGEITNTLLISPTVTTVYTVTGTGINGCTDIVSVTQLVNICTGVEKSDVENSMYTIYPNPFNDELYVNGSYTPYKLFVYNSIGQKLLEEFVKNEAFKIDTKSFSSGVYFIQIHQNNQIKGSKLIKR